MEFERKEFTKLSKENETIEGAAFTDCIFDSCSFEALKIVNSRFTDCKFINCHIGNIKGSSSEVYSAEFSKCRIVGINLNDFQPSGQFSSPVNSFQGCNIKYCSFSEINFNRFGFSGNEISDSFFGECKLREADFHGCTLRDTEFFRCDLQKADFKEAIGYKIDVLTNKLRGAAFSFPEVVNLLGGLGIKID